MENEKKFSLQDFNLYKKTLKQKLENSDLKRKEIKLIENLLDENKKYNIYEIELLSKLLYSEEDIRIIDEEENDPLKKARAASRLKRYNELINKINDIKYTENLELLKVDIRPIILDFNKKIINEEELANILVDLSKKYEIYDINRIFDKERDILITEIMKDTGSDYCYI